MRQQLILRFFLSQLHVQVSHLTFLKHLVFLCSHFIIFFFQKRTVVLMCRSLGSEVGWNTPCLLPSFALESCELLMPIGRKDGSWDSFSRQSYHNGGWVQLKPHPGIHALQHQPEQIPAATCTYVSITHELKKIINQENRSKIRKSLMTSPRENKSYMICKTDEYTWFQIQLSGILDICVTFSVFRVLWTIIWQEIFRSKGWWLVAHILWTTTERLRYLSNATQWLLAEASDPWFSLLYVALFASMMKYFFKISVASPRNTSPHYPFTFSWEIGLIGTNCPATAKSIVLPVASGTCAACGRTPNHMGYKRLRDSGTVGSKNCTFLSLPILLKSCFSFKLFQEQGVGETQRRELCSPWNTPACFSSSPTGCAGLSSEGAKGHHLPGLFNAWCTLSVRPFQCLNMSLS